jgi:cytochrome c-type biogenesis protein CcmH
MGPCSWSISISMLLTCIATMFACDLPNDPAHRIQEVERRILAPCCRRQTLEDHDSEIARALRAEIRDRVAAGEPPTTIEDDLVRRYGEDIRAMPRGWDPRALLGAGLGVVIGLGALMLLRFARRGRAPATVRAVSIGPPGEGDVDDAQRIDDELLELD